MVSDAGLGLGAALFPRWTRYIPHKPYAKQLAAMMLPHKEVLFGGSSGSGKALSLDTLVATPDGYARMGELTAGDLVVGLDGWPTQVVATSPVMMNMGYKLTFSEGTVVYADENHSWLTRVKGVTSLKTTKEIADSLIPYHFVDSRFITRAECVGLIDVRCIQISNVDGMFFVTSKRIPTHNSDWLLMCALQFCDVPGYSAVIFRKTLTDLQLEGNLIPRSHDWLSDTPAKWDGQKHCWYFPCGPANRWDKPDFSLKATLQFGYMGAGYGNVMGMQKHRYQSAEFQFVGFDELTQHFEGDYEYMFSRLRAKQCPLHSQGEYHPRCRECREAYAVSKVPLRFRSATNPGGLGGKWVKKRFKIKRVGYDANNHAIFKGMDPARPYIPATVEDNPSIQLTQYDANLSELGRVERLQLRWGDWEVAAEGRFQRDWFKLYSIRGDMVVLGSSHNAVGVKYYPLKSCIRFMTLDPAASIKEGPGDRQIWANANPSRTACCSWLMTPAYDLLWVHTLAHYLEVPDILPVVRREAQQHRPDWIGIENNGFNLAIYQEFQRSGLTVQPFSPLSGDKLVRSTPAQVRAERGKVFIPEAAIGEEWLEDSLSEVCNWTGHPQEVDDIVDNLAYAGDWVHNQAIGEGGQRMFPTASK